MTDFSDRLRNLMEDRGLTPSELARRVWLDIFRERNMTFTDEQVEAACDAYRAVTGDRLALVDFNAMRRALEAAAQAAPAPKEGE